jgi:hypothetical protein
MRTFVFLLVLLICSLPAPAQVKNIRYTAPEEIVWAGVDRASDLLLVLQSGAVEKINLSGKRVGRYKFDQIPTLIDPLDGAQAFYYFRSTGAYGTLSSDLSFTHASVLEPSLAVTPWLVCPMLHELWILDVGDFTLKKTASGASTQGWETVLPKVVSRNPEDLIYMKEYQNYIFLLDRSAGVHVFNSLGRYVKTLAGRNASYFAFIGEEIYSIQESRMNLTDLYSGETRILDLPTKADFTFVVHEFLYSIKNKEIIIAPFKP